MSKLYGLPPLPPSVDMGMPLDDPEEPPTAPRGVMVMGEIRNIEIETDMEPVADAILGLSVAIAGVEEAVNALPDRMPSDPPDDPTPIIEAIDRLVTLVAKQKPTDISPVVRAIDRLSALVERDALADEAPVEQVIERDKDGNVVSVTTTRAGVRRVRTVKRDTKGLIVGTVER